MVTRRQAMDVRHQLEQTPFGASLRLPFSRSLMPWAGALAVLSASLFCASGNYRDAAIAAATVLGAAFMVVANVSVEAILVTWFITTPIASFFIRVPLDRSIITYNRTVFGLLIIVLLLRRRSSMQDASKSSDSFDSPDVATTSVKQGSGLRSFSITKFEAAWALLSLAALVSVAVKSYDPAYAARVAIDALWLPLVAFHITRNHFDLRRCGRALVLGVIALALFLTASGAIEFVTGSDLFRYKGSEILREGERRINGPFISDSSYSIICLMLFLFLLGARRLTRIRFDRSANLAYVLALAGAAAGVMLSLFRSVMAALVLCWIVLEFSGRLERRSPGLSGPSALLRRVALGPLIAVIILAIIAGAASVAPSLVQSRLSDPRTAFGRLATWRAAATLTLSNPAFGVGLGNYPEYFRDKRWYRGDLIQDVFYARAADSPHSNLLWIAAELGVIALGLYLAANIYLFLMGWRTLRRSSESGKRIAASLFLALLFAYWIPGLALASGEYSELNLCFFFLLGALSSEFSRSQAS
ncbi:MAG TPA: O-antigen ligase family protein [Blastocatellia bacterium]|nr:O-antigen ligase family protein [Blastocatellia bacterium]